MRDEHAEALGFGRRRPRPSVTLESLNGDATLGQLHREGLDLALEWEGVVRFSLAAIRDGREGVRGELTVTREGRRLSWGVWTLASTAAREPLRKKLEMLAPGCPWGVYLEEAALRLTQAHRDGEPLVTLTGTATAPSRALVPKLLYEGEPTLVFADGDSGKSLLGTALAVAVASGTALPAGLQPAHAAPVAYLDWETGPETVDHRLALLAAGLGIAPPPILYKRMSRPLAEAAAALAADFARRGIRLVVLDSHMFACGASDGAAVHEPITRYYQALRLFGATTATLTLSHVTGADARSAGPGRPYGGAFSFNGPRLIWEGKRDREADGLALVLTARKANNLPHVPPPFGLRFEPVGDRITVAALDLAEAPPSVMAGAGLTYRLRLALAHGSKTVEALAAELEVGPDSIRRVLNRHRRTDRRGLFVALENSKPQLWALAAGVTP